MAIKKYEKRTYILKVCDNIWSLPASVSFQIHFSWPEVPCSSVTRCLHALYGCHAVPNTALRSCEVARSQHWDLLTSVRLADISNNMSSYKWDEHTHFNQLLSILIIIVTIQYFLVMSTIHLTGYWSQCHLIQPMDVLQSLHESALHRLRGHTSDNHNYQLHQISHGKWMVGMNDQTDEMSHTPSGTKHHEHCHHLLGSLQNMQQRQTPTLPASPECLILPHFWQSPHLPLKMIWCSQAMVQ